MRLLPQDLGTKWHILLTRHRALGVASVWTKPNAPRLGTLGKRWIQDLPVSEEVAATTLPLAPDKTNGIAWGIGSCVIASVAGLAFGLGGDLLAQGNISGFLTAEALTLGFGGAAGYASFIGLPRMHLKKLHNTPVQEDELAPFLTGNVPGLPQIIGEMAGKLLRFLNQSAPSENDRDPLEMSFLSLVRDVLRNDTVPEHQQDDLRAAVRAIGEALCRLPPIGQIENAGSSLLAADQRAEAQTLRARSNRESDPVIAGSLERQAAALENAARASENGVVVARRVRALRQELRAQMEVLRLTLPTWGQSPRTATAQTHTAHTEATLGNIAEAVQSVAREAVAITDAHDELEDFLSATEPRSYNTSPTEEKQTLRAR
ncbi:MAG: hypothetical protein H7Y38_00575 [Armatimonadetes bacterium]|nr:hypothetical protein [Armatimonadota bacterium]